MLHIHSKTAGKRAKVATKKKAGLTKGTMLKAKSGSKWPSEIELALAKPVKKMRKFALALSTVQASGPGDIGVSMSHAPTTPTMKALVIDAAARVRLISMLEVLESREFLPCDLVPPLSEEALHLPDNPTVSLVGLMEP
jgi:hypothetical protein